MPDLQWNIAAWDGSYDWSTGGEEWSQVWGGSEAQWFGSLYPRLEESGVAFIHHSNFHVNTDHGTNPHCRATSVSAEKVAGLVAVHGGRVLLQGLLNWGRSDPCDCITVLAPNGSRYPATPLVLNNRSYMAEAEIIKNYQSPYAILGS